MNRDAVAALPPSVDVLVVGGGITGAGIALEAARRGVSVLLVEARDFAWGTSSRSSKLVHGGLRYLAAGRIGLTRESVRERRQLMHDAPGLVEQQRFLMGHYTGRAPSSGALAAALAIYDFFNGARTRRFHSAGEVTRLAPHVGQTDLLGGSSYLEAKTDDARLVLRVLQEARRHGARLLNYTAAEELLRDGGGVRGARLRLLADTPPGGTAVHEVQARCVINATGVWADALRGQLGRAPKLRPLRGSHLLLPLWRLPLGQCIALLHPRDRRPVFAYPWEGAALVGTTDLDEPRPLDEEPCIGRGEVAYLMEALQCAFPSLQLGAADVLSTYAGVRPVVAGGATDPSKEARDSVILREQSLITVTGGKLTTFRASALDALRHVARAVPELTAPRNLPGHSAIFDPVPPSASLARLNAPLQLRLTGRYGRHAEEVIACGQDDGLECVPGTATLWAELLHAARSEQVRHLDDLLLRRTRLGLLLREGARAILPRVQALCAGELGWDQARWQAEHDRYLAIVARSYALPPETAS
ncbi:MAG: glycerol-3-phosphate dehydrogenase/oxidase [SAR324 cluster bacterium]